MTEILIKQGRESFIAKLMPSNNTLVGSQSVKLMECVGEKHDNDLHSPSSFKAENSFQVSHKNMKK